jgi:hypothetical protein
MNYGNPSEILISPDSLEPLVIIYRYRSSLYFCTGVVAFGLKDGSRTGSRKILTILNQCIVKLYFGLNRLKSEYNPLLRASVISIAYSGSI